MRKMRSLFQLQHKALRYQFRFMIVCTLILVLVLQIAYVIGFSRLITARATKTASEQMKQAADNINQAANRLKQSSSTLAFSEYVQEIIVSKSASRNFELYSYVAEMMSSITSADANIYGVFLLNNETRKISDPLNNDDGVMDELRAAYGVCGDSFTAPAFFDGVKGHHNTFYAYAFPIFRTYASGDGKRIGCGVFLLNISQIASLIKLESATQNARFFLLDSANRIVASNRASDQGTFTDVFWPEGAPSCVQMNHVYDGKRTIAQYQIVESTGWKIVSVIPVIDLTGDIYRLFITGFAISMGILILMMAVYSMSSRNIAQPVRAIADFLTQAARDGSLRGRLSIPYQNESGDIAEHVNLLLDRVQQITDENARQQKALYDAKIEEKQAVILALQSQIRPHFLYNTLNCLNAICLANNVLEGAVITKAMSDIFRYSVKSDPMVTVREELACIDQYLQIMALRYPGRFTVCVNVADELLGCPIPRMTLQPIVENSMYHGLEQTVNHGSLRLEGRVVNETDMCFLVEDNGVGISESALSTLLREMKAYESGAPTESGHGIGLSNINKRIKLVLGREYGIRIESREGLGTRVFVRLPYPRAAGADAP